VDVILSGAAVMVAAALVITKMIFWLYCKDILYFPELRWLYAMAREL
jgi:hypothetical protein